MTTKKIDGAKASSLRGMTHWTVVKSMTDVEIRLAALADKDAPELRDDELVQFRRERKSLFQK